MPPETAQPTVLKVGELARRAGLTVRALHHYHHIGLLTPSARAASGYRLYNRDDVARLHQIQALRRMGLDLAGIGAVLADPARSFADTVERQIAMLERQIDRATTLRGQLLRLRGELANGDEPALAALLTTMEMMTMYDKYFTPEELQRLPLYQAGNADAKAEWRALVDEVRAMMAAGATPETAAAQDVAARWMALVQRDTNHDPRLFDKLNRMHENEAALQRETGISPELMDFVLRASAEAKYAIYARYLNPAELAYLRANYARRTGEWPPLMAAVREQMALAAPAAAPPMQALAARWLDLFTSYAGDHPDTRARIRHALASEPALRSGFVDESLLGYVRQAITVLQGQAGAIPAPADNTTAP